MIQCGAASWYDESAGTQSADGGRVDPSALAAAHRSLPFGTRVRVENLSNGRAATLIIKDRGPFVRGRIIDVTRAAAEALAFIDSGITRVRISTLELGMALAEDAATDECPDHSRAAPTGLVSGSGSPSAPGRMIHRGRVETYQLPHD